jgi:hypothetical protein
MLPTDPQSLRDEIDAAVQYRDKFLANQDTLISRYHGRYHRSDKKPDSAVASNHAYEFVSIMLPSMIYTNPRCNIRAINPMQVAEGTDETIGQVANGIEQSLNRWSENDEIADVLGDIAIDFYFSYGVAMVTTADQPGFYGTEMVPQRPLIVHIDNKHFVIDPTSLTWNVMQTNGPRYMAHMWKADKEDLINDKDYNPAVIREIDADGDISKYDFERAGGSQVSIPKRKEIIGWEVWVPEVTTANEPGFNGTIETIAIGNTPDGKTKKTRKIRDSRPAYCPPWGPYVLFGAYKVPKSPFPLSPLMATAEIAEEVNSHRVAAAEAARSYKRFGYGEAENSSDMDRIVAVKNGQFILLNQADKSKVGQMELGGTSDTQYRYINFSTENLNQASGLSDAMRGQPKGHVTATAEARSAVGSDLRVAGLKRQYRKAVTRVFKSAGWFAFYGEDFLYNLEDGAQYVGGIVENGRSAFNYFDLGLAMDPYSMEHTDQVLLQRRIMEAYKVLVESAPTMAQTPWINWKEPLKTLFQVLNVGDPDEWVNFAELLAGQGMARAQEKENLAGGVSKRIHMSQAQSSGPRTPSAPIAAARSTGSAVGQASSAGRLAS